VRFTVSAAFAGHDAGPGRLDGFDGSTCLAGFVQKGGQKGVGVAAFAGTALKSKNQHG
jgi:hypothetical protein